MQLVGVFDINNEAAVACSSACNAPVSINRRIFFASDDVDAVLIAAATSTCSDYIEAAVAAGHGRW